MKVATYVSIREAARMAGVGRTAMRIRLHELNRLHGGGIIVPQPGGKRPMVNLVSMRSAWPELFAQHLVTRDEFDALKRAVERMSKTFVAAMAAIRS